MGTTESSETLAFAEYLRSLRETTQEEADALYADHRPQLRYTAPRDRSVAAAH